THLISILSLPPPPFSTWEPWRIRASTSSTRAWCWRCQRRPRMVTMWLWRGSLPTR
ncbi:unnamed protein product, partial [Closterium sp. Yama58-4]